jgi:hypothetical protein
MQRKSRLFALTLLMFCAFFVAPSLSNASTSLVAITAWAGPSINNVALIASVNVFNIDGNIIDTGFDFSGGDGSWYAADLGAIDTYTVTVKKASITGQITGWVFYADANFPYGELGYATVVVHVNGKGVASISLTILDTDPITYLPIPGATLYTTGPGMLNIVNGGAFLAP